MRTRSLFSTAVLLCGCSLHHRPAVPEPVRGPTRDSLFHLDQTRADSVAASGAVDGLLAFLAPDVVYLRAGVPAVYGRDAVRALMTAGGSASAAEITWQPLGGGVSNDLHSAYTFGIAARAAQPRAMRLERYIAYWRRLPDQSWRIAAYAEVGVDRATVGVLPADRPAPAGRPQPKSTREAIAMIRATDSLFSDLADRMGNAFAFANSVDPYGVVFGAPQLVIGPKAVQEFFSAERGGSSLSWHPIYADVAGSLDLGFTIGEYSVTSLSTSGATIQRFGKYLTVWKRQPDGTWKFVIDGGNGTPTKGE